MCAVMTTGKWISGPQPDADLASGKLTWLVSRDAETSWH
jgi:hypothetical protein